MKRNQFIISKEERILKFLNIFKDRVGERMLGGIELSFSSLMENAELKGIPPGGSFSNTLTDSVTLELISSITNGVTRYKLTELGIKLIRSPTERALWKQAYLNVPLYKDYYNLFPEDKSYQSFFMWFHSNHKISRDTQKLLNMGVRRFFEGVHGIKLPFRLEKHRRKLTLNDFKSEEIDNDHSPMTIDEDLFQLIEILKKSKDKYSKSDIKRLLEVL